jgi:hypothetical protein
MQCIEFTTQHHIVIYLFKVLEMIVIDYLDLLDTF